MSFVNRSRRMGERLAVHGLVLSWNTRGRRSPRWKRRQFDEADVIDVSVSGAQFLAPDNLSIIVGQKVTIVAGGAIGVVRVKRIVPVTNGPLALYGTEYITLEPALEALLFSHLDAVKRPPDTVVWR